MGHYGHGGIMSMDNLVMGQQLIGHHQFRYNREKRDRLIYCKNEVMLLKFFTLITPLTFPDINGVFYLCNRGKGGMIKMGIHCDDSINTIFKRKNYKIIPYVNSTGGA